MTKPQLPNLQQTVNNTILITNISNSNNFNKLPSSHQSSFLNGSQSVSESVSDKHTSCRKVTQSFSNKENCYDNTRHLALFTAIKSTKRYGVGQSVSRDMCSGSCNVFIFNIFHAATWQFKDPGNGLK